MGRTCNRCGESRDIVAGGDKGHKSGTRECPMTDEMWAALIAWRDAHGYFWKQRLTVAWSHNLVEVTSVPALMQARNVIGPSRLYYIKLPKEKKA
jgi:hypothetical protein